MVARQVWGGALMLALLVGGCSSSDSAEGSAGGADDPLVGADLSIASEAQAAEIADRTVTANEYQAAFQRYRECLSAAGFELSDVELENGVYDFGVPDAAVQDGADEDCYEGEYYFVDMLWQTSDAILNASESTQRLRTCLQEHGVEPGDTRAEIDVQLREEAIDISECLP